MCVSIRAVHDIFVLLDMSRYAASKRLRDVFNLTALTLSDCRISTPPDSPECIYLPESALVEMLRTRIVLLFEYSLHMVQQSTALVRKPRLTKPAENSMT